ncbi:unnamed protein product [Gongylonema pulchrum]|uniref:DUF4347 domain-containing protein n=1 Tax=Gongylonema pulchrum TaxID=637853 RepID=A0A183E2I6_9BILA|nr:unnamed protein product [Gongylonema pulchrum]
MGLYAEWPLLEFTPLSSTAQTSSLSLFSKGTGDNVAELLVREIAENLKGAGTVAGFKIDTEEQLSWILQVIYAWIT